MHRRLLVVLTVAMASLVCPGCGYNRLQGLDEDVKASWSEVLNQCQRRYDLVPNLVNVVKGAAAHESDTLKAVVEARARVGQIQAGEQTFRDPKAMQEFEQAQSGLASALQRLMVVVEQYPNLKANENFLTLQSQLEGTENRIAVARGRYIGAVKEYNKAIRYFPSNLTAKHILHMQPVETFQPKDKAVEEAPEVKF